MTHVSFLKDVTFLTYQIDFEKKAQQQKMNTKDTGKLEEFKISKYLRTEDNLTTVLGMHKNSTESVVQKILQFPNDTVLMSCVEKVKKKKKKKPKKISKKVKNIISIKKQKFCKI